MVIYQNKTKRGGYERKKIIWQNVQKYRKLKKLTQENLAEIIGVDATSISSIETGKYFVSAENLSKLAKALDIEISELFVFENLCSKEKTYKEIIDILDHFKDDNLRLNAIKSFLKALI